MKQFFLILALFISGFGLETSIAADKPEITLEKEVLDIIRKNPEIIMEAIQILQARESKNNLSDAEKFLKNNKKAIELGLDAPVLGNPFGDVTIVEFLDYNCGYCRKAFKTVMELLAEDKNIRVVMREWPILGNDSVVAARASLAAHKQKKYNEFHIALMENRGRNSAKSVMSLAKEVGLDIEILKKDMELTEIDAHIENSKQLAQMLNLTGTPGFIFGEEIVPGAIGLDQMREFVAKIRNRG